MAWNGSDSGKAKARGEGEQRRKSPSAVRLSPSPKFNYKVLVAGLIVVIGGGIAAWVMTRGGGGEKGETGERAKPSQIAEVAPAVATNAAATIASGETAAGEPGRGKAGSGREGTIPGEAGEECGVTNDVAALTATNATKRLFANPMDQLLSMVMPQEAGDSVPPLPISDDETFTPEQEKQMFERLAAAEGDSDEVLERKELVQAMRDEYAQLKKERGWSFVEYLKALQSKVDLDSEVKTESYKIHETVFGDPDVSDEEYLKTLEKINDVLRERGIKPIKPPAEEDGGEDNQKQEGK